MAERGIAAGPWYSGLALDEGAGVVNGSRNIPGGNVEGWGIGPATPVKEVTLKVSAATGAQLRELLKKLPDGMTFELSLDKEDS